MDAEIESFCQLVNSWINNKQNLIFCNICFLCIDILWEFLYLFPREQKKNVFQETSTNKIHILKYVIESGQAILGGAKAGLFPGISGRGGDVVSLPGLLQTSQTDVEVLHLTSTVLSTIFAVRRLIIHLGTELA